MKSVLLTGATGFIGRHTLPLLLERGYQVHAVTPEPLHERQEGVQYHEADLLDPLQLADLVAAVQPTHLLHFAWCTAPGDYWTSLDNLRWVQASLSLLQAFSQHHGRRVVMAGTCAEYDWQYGYCSEGLTPLSPVSLYGICKHSLSLIVQRFCAQTELSGAWGRIFLLYGPYEHPDRLVPTVVRSLLQGVPARCSRGSQVRDLLHVHDVANAFVALLDSEVTGPVNIASGCPVALSEIIYKIADKLGRRDLIQLGAVPMSAGEPPLLIADTRRLVDEVGWSPEYDLDSGLDQTIEWWREQMPERAASSAARQALLVERQ
jgi:nucleoside-diphosphate-sugar epimerase